MLSLTVSLSYSFPSPIFFCLCLSVPSPFSLPFLHFFISLYIQFIFCYSSFPCPDTPERRSYNSSPAHSYPASNSSNPGAAPSGGAASTASALFTSIRGSAGSLVKNIRDASSKVMDTVSAWVNWSEYFMAAWCSFKGSQSGVYDKARIFSVMEPVEQGLGLHQVINTYCKVDWGMWWIDSRVSDGFKGDWPITEFLISKIGQS